MTVESERLLKQILSADEVQFCVHGTYKRNLESILELGLKHMKRLHVHFSSGLLTDGEVISGIQQVMEENEDSSKVQQEGSTDKNST
ncbi:hypothetical protein V6Z12_D05G000200 [Gossypium hirsutum]